MVYNNRYLEEENPWLRKCFGVSLNSYMEIASLFLSTSFDVAKLMNSQIYAMKFGAEIINLPSHNHKLTYT
jgi:hypothetical protein